MLHYLDEALRQLLLDDAEIKKNRIAVAFDQPTQEWAARRNQQLILNLFLYDVRENNKLRQARPHWETVSQNGAKSVERRRQPVRVDVHYLITAWANVVEDEHQILSLALLALFRHPELPEAFIPPELQDQPTPIALMVAQEDTLRNPAEVWSAMDSEMRPSIPLVVTLALNPFQPFETRLVRERGLRVEPHLKRRDKAYRDEEDKKDENKNGKYRWAIGGTVTMKEKRDHMKVILAERGEPLELKADGRFAIGNLSAGTYTLIAMAGDDELGRCTFEAPGPEFEFEV